MQSSPGPLLAYEGVTKDTLRQRWTEERCRREATFGKCEVLCFHKENEKHGCFSNWFMHDPIEFEVPCWCRLEGLPPIVPVTFFEKAIMLCKAGVMGDREAYQSLLETEFPKQAKDIGQGVQNFDEQLWGQVVCSVAFEVVMQKFGKSGLAEYLTATGDKLLVEAAPNDVSWGIGLKSTDPSAQLPEQWRGTNVLGWALMEARDCLVSAHMRLFDGTIDMAACRAHGRRVAHGSADDATPHAVGSTVVADVVNPVAVDLLLKVVGNLLQVPVDPKFLSLKDDGVRKRCGECYNGVAAVLTRLGFVLDELSWVYSANLSQGDTIDMLQGAQRHLMTVDWLHGR